MVRFVRVLSFIGRAYQHHESVIGVSFLFAGLTWVFVVANQKGLGWIGAALTGLVGLATIGIVIRRLLDPKDDLPSLVRVTTYVLFAVIADYSFFYYTCGAEQNWSIRLTHLDALFITFGTLTTAGTGDIHPRTELARGLMMSQMIVDILTVTVMATLLLARLGASRAPLSRPNGPARNAASDAIGVDGY
jgi:hypothetical protein